MGGTRRGWWAKWLIVACFLTRKKRGSRLAQPSSSSSTAAAKLGNLPQSPEGRPGPTAGVRKAKKRRTKDGAQSVPVVQSCSLPLHPSSQSAESCHS